MILHNRKQSYFNEQMNNKNFIVLQNLKKDIREANKKNKMLKFLRKKAQDRKIMKQHEIF